MNESLATQRRFLLPLVLPALLVFTSSLPAQPTSVIFQDFRDGKPLIDEFKLIGPDAAAVSKLEVGGLRITLPKTRKQNQPVGVRLKFPLTGDFEMTGAYELLSIDQPATNVGVGVGFNLVARQDYKRFVKVGRFVFPKLGSVHMGECWDKDNPKLNKEFSEPNKARAGQLRLVREGAKIRYLAADAPSNDFRELWATEFVADDLEIVRFAANNNGAPAGVDVRLFDFKIRIGPANADIPGAPVAVDPAAAPPEKGGLNGLLWLVVLLGVGFTLLLAVGALAWFVLRQR